MHLRNLFIGLTLSMIATSSMAAFDVTLTVKGIITSGGCTLSADSKNLSVRLGGVAISDLNGPAHAGLEKLFQLRLENCASDTGGARVSFSGFVDNHNPQLLAIQGSNASASGVGIAILDREHKPVLLNERGDFISFDNDELQTQTLDFYARYVANGEAVQAGEANATATFTVEYQ